MKKDIHPTYYPDAVVVCACGNTWKTGSTKQEIRTDVCSKCHPFFTGEQRIVDTEGQVDRFYKKLQARESYIREKEEKAAARISPERPIYFTGEMIYPWMFDEIGGLRPLKEAAEILAARDDWPDLYDPAVLARNRVPAAAAVYYNDMYVERELSEKSAAVLKGTRLWVTNEHEHSALRMHGETVFARLYDMLHGEI